ncbi:hypothetical protein R1flu_021039 [Riccia fluitans]|uniref:Uncharacterized protein n=1 Tax=Riccia fluitans TaxID=41844 RepID=A0ABD1ZQ80_9MARC
MFYHRPHRKNELPKRTTEVSESEVPKVRRTPDELSCTFRVDEDGEKAAAGKGDEKSKNERRGRNSEAHCGERRSALLWPVGVFGTGAEERDNGKARWEWGKGRFCDRGGQKRWGQVEFRLSYLFEGMQIDVWTGGNPASNDG